MRIIASHYTHVDNGGYTFKVVEEDGTLSIIVEDGYYGYSSAQLRFFEDVSPENLRRISVMFSETADKIENPRSPTLEIRR